MTEPTDETPSAEPSQNGAVDTGKRVDVRDLPGASFSDGGAVDTGKRVDPAALPSGERKPQRRVYEPPRKGRDDEAGRGRGRDDGRRGDRPRGPNRPSYADQGPAPIERRPTSPEEAGDFAAMLAESGPIDHMDVRVGDKVHGEVVHIGKDAVFIELSGTQEAHMPTAEFLDDQGALHVKLGDRIDAFVTSLDGGILLSRKIGKGQIDVAMLEQAKVAGIPIDGSVVGVNKGGLEIQLSGTRGFCPIGQADLHFVENPQALVGKTLSFLVKEVKEGGRNVLLSRKALLERERKEKADRLLKELAPGKVITGTVTRIQPFGAFVDLGGLDGLIPVSELSHVRIADPSEVVKVGELVKVEVTKIEDDPKRAGQMRIGLSLKTLMQDPFDANASSIVPGATLEGRVVRLETYGAFVELFPGVQGLLHVSEIADQRIRHPMDVLKPDERVKVRVVDFDPAARRVSLSMREARERVDAPAAEKKSGGLGRGAQVEAVVEKIEKYGVFLKMENGTTVFMPASETGTPRGSDLHKAFPIGGKHALLVIEVDDRGRLKVSKVAREAAEERAIVEQYNTASKGAGFGTLGDLLKKR